jgi:hypothetical protein
LERGINQLIIEVRKKILKKIIGEAKQTETQDFLEISGSFVGSGCGGWI